MKLTTNTYQRLLWITASASLLGIVGCSNLPRTASSNNTALYGSNDDRSLDRISVIGLSPTAYNALDNPHPSPAGGGGNGGSASTSSSSSAASSGTSSSSTASSGTSSGGHSGGK